MVSEVRSAEEWFRDFILLDGAAQQVATFCNVTTGTALGWRDGAWPRGEPMYRLWVLLELNGCKVKELEELPWPSHRLALLGGCDICTYDEAREELGYDSLKSLFRLLRNESSPSSDKVRRLEKLLGVYEADLTKFINDFEPIVPELLANDKGVGVVTPPEEVVLSSPQVFRGDTSAELMVRLLQQFIRRIGRADMAVVADKMKQQ